MLEDAFDKLGFLPNEVKLYLTLLEGGKCGAHSLTRRTGLPRTTVYSSLRTLEEKNLVSKERSADRLVFTAQDPDELIKRVQIEERSIQERRKAAAHLSELLKPFMKKGAYSVPETKLFEGKRHVAAALINRLEKWQTSTKATDNTWWGFQDHTYVEQFGDALKFHLESLSSNEQVKIFSNEAIVEKKLRGKIKNRDIRVFPFPVEFDGTLWAFGDYIVFLQSRQTPIYLVELLDPVLAKNVRGFFKAVWKLTD